MEFKEMYYKHRKACEKLQALDDSIKRILTNIEYGKYSEKELLLEYTNLKALHHMKIERERMVEETKKSLSQRWNDFNGIKIQRDMYSAFLIMNINDDLKSFDIDKCNERFENFYQLYNLEVNRLIGKKNLSSIAI